VHKIDISQETHAAARRWRGSVHLFEHIDPKRTAHLVVDLQNVFMEPGAPVEVPVARDIVPNVNTISSAVRDHGGHNVFLRMTIDAAAQASWSNWFGNLRESDGRESFVRGCAPGSKYWQLWPALSLSPDDSIVDKSRFGAFAPGSSDLHALLQKRGVDTLIISGTVTGCCCEATAREAMQMNYKVIFVADATAAMSDAAQNATLQNMAILFADVMMTNEVVELLRKSAATATNIAGIAK
jgi:ureidoacrylate peracid hydrolase